MRWPILPLLVVAVGAAAARDSLDTAIRTAMTRERVPGLSFAVVRHGRIVRQGAYGYANLEWNTPVTSRTRFEIASLSKMFVGAAARTLIEEGRLDPEAAVDRYFQGVPESWHAMKVRHLMTMSSGLPEDFASDLIPYNQDVTTPYDDASMLRAFFSLKMLAAPGERFIYSSPNYAMLSMIVSNIAGKPFPDFVRERIFTPAAMADSSYIDNRAIVPQRADGYRKIEGGELRKGWYLGQYLHARPDDGVSTTAVDLAKWIIALEQRKIVREPERLWEAAVADSGRPLDYSYGWITDTWLGHRRVEHSGGLRTGFHTFIARYPDDDLAVVVLTNCDFSQIRDYVGAVARTYIPGVPDPSQEATRPDADPAATGQAIAALRSVVSGSVDEGKMYADAVEPVGIAVVAGFLKAAGPFSYAGRGRVGARGLVMHGHPLVDYVTLQTRIGNAPVYVTLYGDASKKIGYVELTN